MPAPGLQQKSFGPFVKGLIDAANPSTDTAGALRASMHWVYSGQDRLSVRPGLVPQLTLMDDAGTPAPVTTVCAVQAFGSGAVAIAHSSTTQKVYLYYLNATLTGYFDTTSYTLHTQATALPLAIVWSSMAAAPDVMLAEGLGVLFIANTQASDPTGLFWPSKWWDSTNTTVPGTLSSLHASGTFVNNVSTQGTDVPYFLGLISFSEHLWAWGYGVGSSAGFTSFRPELARYSVIDFGGASGGDPTTFMLTDSITIGDRVRSQRERIIGAGVAGASLFLCAAETVVQITGDGRDSWQKTAIDKSFGIVGPKAGITAGDYFYYFSSRGPMRIVGLPQAYGLPPRPEPLYDVVFNAVQTIQNEARIVAFFDPDRDQVGWMYDAGTGLRTFLTYDIRRNRYVSSAADMGVVLNNAGSVKAIFASTASPPTGPSGPPTTPSTTNVSSNGATANWVAGDLNAQTEVSVATSNGIFTVVATVSAGVSSYGFASQTQATAYQWRVRHTLNGGASSYLGPATGTMYTTLSPGTGGTGPPATLPAPKNLSATVSAKLNSLFQVQPQVNLTWTNTAPAAETIPMGGPTLTGPFEPAGPVAPGGASSLSILYGAGSTPPEFWVVAHRSPPFADGALSNVAKAF